MKVLSPRRIVTTLCLFAALTCIPAPTTAQSILDKIKKAAEDASKKNPPPAQPSSTPTTPTNTQGNKGQPAPAAGRNAGTPAAAAANLGPSTAKVESQLLVNGEAGMKFAISPHGTHLAAITSKGSRVAITQDGTQGPPFDEILTIDGVPGAGWVRFNDDGSHYVYVGRSGQEYVVMLDQKEMGRGPYASKPVKSLGFTPGGKHMYYITLTFDGSRSHAHLVLDGKPGPESNDPISPLFSPDGEHHAYVLDINPLRGTPSSQLVVDGKVMPYPGGPVAYSGDSAHLFTEVQVGPTQALSVDGKEFLKAQVARLFAAPIGNLFVVIVSQGIQTQPGGVQFLVIGNQKVPGSECLGSGGLSDLTFSPDGKHWAVKCQATNTSHWVMADGKKGLEYNAVSDVHFTSDGRPVYVAQNNGKTYMVAGTEESSGFSNIPAFLVDGTIGPAIAGKQVGFIGLTSTPGIFSVVVGTNKPITRKDEANLMLSPDGSRFAFTTPDGGVNVDGVDDGAAFTPVYHIPDDHGRQTPPSPLMFSPDSKHVFYIGRPTINDLPGIVIDGKYLAIGRGVQPTEPVFTPDGKHLFWLDHDEGDPMVLYLDGKRAATITFANRGIGGWYEMNSDGSLNVITQDGADLKRLHIIPTDDGGLDKLIAAAKPLPKK